MRFTSERVWMRGGSGLLSKGSSIHFKLKFSITIVIDGSSKLTDVSHKSSFRTQLTFEQGLIHGMHEKIRRLWMERVVNAIPIFDDLEDYIENFTKVTGIKLANLLNLFIIYFGCLLAILLGFSISKKLPKKTLKLFRRLSGSVWHLLDQTVFVKLRLLFGLMRRRLIALMSRIWPRLTKTQLPPISSRG